jgi:predicted membrane-bound spermidine synthase
MGRSRHLFLLFFLSGISGLLYESLWSRYLKLFVGSAATAQIIVLALFMGGMSLGSLIMSRRSETISRPVLAYGLIEGAIGAYAIAFPLLFELVTRLCYDTLFPAVGGEGVGLVKWSFAALLIAPPCILLGTTFPLMSVGILRRDKEHSGEILSFLYFSNSFGAALGAVLSGFVLVPKLGLPGTLLVGAAINLVIMAVCLRERGRAADAPLAAGAVELATTAETPKTDPRLLQVMLAIALGTGLSSFMYEIAWIRMLSMVLGSATHSFEVMLSAFVFGLALGGLWVRKRMDRFKRPELALGLVQLIMGAMAIATIYMYWVGVMGIAGIFKMGGEEHERTMAMWVLFNTARYLICLLVMLPATFCAGMTLPLVTHVLLRRGQPESAVGRVYGVNTLGSIAGAVLAGMVMLPLMGLKNTIVTGALIDMALGIWLVQREWNAKPSDVQVRKLVRSSTIMAVSLAIIGYGLMTVDPRVLAAGVFRRGRAKMHDDYDVVMHVDGRTATVTVTHDREREGYFTLYTNGKPDASVQVLRWPAGRKAEEGPFLAGDEPTQLLLAIVPLLARPQAKRAATIGMGSGVTSHVLLASPVLERLDTVEIEPNMAAGAKLFAPINERVFTDPRSHIIFDDAKAYFAAAEGSYDLIVSEPSNPWVSGVSSLFTVEFYQEIRRYMAPGGLLGQWMHGYELSDELLLSVLAAVDREFADYRLYRVGDRDWLILAAQEDDGIGALHGEPLTAWPMLTDEAALLGITALDQVEVLAVASDELLRPYLAGVAPNRDTHPLLDNGAETARFFRASAEALLELRFIPLPLLEVFGGWPQSSYATRMSDRREDLHVLDEPERALRNMRLFAIEDRSYGGAISAYLEARDALDTAANLDAGNIDEATREVWFAGVYAVYLETAPWLDLRMTEFWTEVLTAATPERVGARNARAIELLDAVMRRDPALRQLAQAELDAGDSPLHPRLLALAGAIGLVLDGASASERAAYAEQHMSPLVSGETSEDIAYAVVVAWMRG